jgi:thioredoxin 1
VNVDQSPILTLRYQVFGLPTTLIFKDGQIVERLSGNVSVVQLQQKIQSYL